MDLIITRPTGTLHSYTEGLDLRGQPSDHIAQSVLAFLGATIPEL